MFVRKRLRLHTTYITVSICTDCICIVQHTHYYTANRGVDMDDFATFVAKERDRLATARADLMKQIDKLNKDIAKIDQEFEAIAAYEAAKSGKPVAKATRSARRSGVRDEVLAAIKSAGSANRADLLVQLNAKGDKAAEQSVSNALAALKKAGTITADEGVYKVAG